jgi:hypothetical protein
MSEWQRMMPQTRGRHLRWAHGTGHDGAVLYGRCYPDAHSEMTEREYEECSAQLRHLKEGPGREAVLDKVREFNLSRLWRVADDQSYGRA